MISSSPDDYFLFVFYLENGNRTIIVLSKSSNECKHESAKFSLKQDGKVGHVQTNKCITYHDLNHFGFFYLGMCNQSTIFTIYSAKLTLKGNI